MIEVEAPDGTIVEFPAGTDDTTIDRVMRENFAPQAGATPAEAPAQKDAGGASGSWDDTAKDMAAAGAAGASRGVTGLMDLPGMAFGAGSRAGAWVAEKTGLASPQEAQAAHQAVSGLADRTMIGSGDKNRNMLADITGGASEYQGQTTAGKYAGTVGEFLPGAFIGGGNALRNAVVNGIIPGLASEGAGQLTEGTPFEPWARVIAPIVAGGAAAAVARPKAPQAPSVDDLRNQAEGLYQQGAARAGADASAVQSLASQIDGELQSLNIKTPKGRVLAEGNVKKFIDVLDDYKGQQMKPEQMQTIRRILTDAAGSADPADRRIGAILLGKFDDWRAQHVPEYAQADGIYGRMKRAEDVDYRVEKAERRADSTGTGGNRVNAARQNIRQILDNPKAQRGYSPDELIAMRAIVSGDRATNALRTIGKLSPTSGALPLMGSIVGASVSPLVGASAMGLTYGAKTAAELLTNRQINALGAMIRNGGPVSNALARGYQGEGTLLALRALMAGSQN